MNPYFKHVERQMEKNIRRRPTKIQAAHQEHPRVRSQGSVVGLELQRHPSDRSGVERPVLRERASPTNSGDEDLAFGAHIRQNEGDVGVELTSVSNLRKNPQNIRIS